MAAGLGFKTFTSGEVLTAADTNGYLMQGVLVFASASARNAAITSPQEGQYCYLKDTNSTQYYDGAAWVSGVEGDISGVTAGTGISGGGTSGTVTITNSMATEIAAKGDLIVGTGSATFDNLTAGADGSSIVADSATATGLRYTENYAAGKNKIINGDFGIWQRGTSFAGLTANAYTADRWLYEPSGATATVSQQTFTPGTAPVSGYEGTYFLRMQVTVADDGYRIAQRIENCRTFAGETITVSFWAKADSAKVIQVAARQEFGSGGSAAVETASGNITLSTSWARYSATLTIPSITGKTIGTSNYFALWFINRVNQTITLDLWGLQAEAGSVATAFQTATANPASELAAAQRYYYRYTPSASVERYGNGLSTATTTGVVGIQYPVQMRTAPTALEQSGTATDYSIVQATGIVVSSAVPVFGFTSPIFSTTTFTVASGLVAGQAIFGRAVNTSAYLGWSAEL